MFFMVFYAIAVVTATARLLLGGAPRTRARVVEVFAQHFLVFGFGLAGIWAFLGHKFRSEEVAKSIGWPAGNPFQEEIAYANLGIGLTGLLCARTRTPFWWATAIASSVFYAGAGLIHIREVIKSGNYAPNNFGIILPDLLLPVTTLALLLIDGLEPDAAG